MSHRIEEGDFVTIIGPCKRTNDLYVVVDEMRKYINDDKEYQVEYIDPDEQEKVEFLGYMWHRDDLKLVRTKDGIPVHDNGLPFDEVEVDPPEEDHAPDLKETDFFKFDDNLIKSII